MSFLDYKTPTLAANNVHFEWGMVEPGLNVESQEPRSHRMFQIGNFYSVTVCVSTQQLKNNIFIIYPNFLCLVTVENIFIKVEFVDTFEVDRYKLVKL